VSEHESGAGSLGLRGRTSSAAPRPMRVLALDPSGGTLARCAGVDGIPHTIETALVFPLEPGAIVLVRAGLALARLDAEWAL
jgi:HupF/HypC family